MRDKIKYVVLLIMETFTYLMRIGVIIAGVYFLWFQTLDMKFILSLIFLTLFINTMELWVK